MYRNTDETKMLNIDLPTRSTTRSDGAVKIYGHTISGDLIAVVMMPSDDGYHIVEVKIAGKIEYCDY